eukprot:m.107877 g.107877  ORF g.107877 m.107877 type:complete len:116 (+) comp13947_c0_seq7:479-826(+)
MKLGTPMCYEPNHPTTLPSNAQYYAASQAIPSFSQPQGTLAADGGGDILGIDCYTAPPFSGSCSNGNGGLRGVGFGTLAVAGYASPAAATKATFQWSPYVIHLLINITCNLHMLL